jgi:site-specific DNA-methyltransferase (adenine-specific)
VGTVAANVLAHGVGGLNIDGCRIGGAAGRWPANVIFDEEAGVMLDEQNGISKDGVSTRPTKKSGYDGGWGAQPDFKHTYGGEGGASRFFYCAKASKRDRNEGLDAFEARRDADRVTDDGVGGDNPRNRSNNAKVNHHPTVKPTELMRYLIRLVTPVGGVLLDPFTGSGSTGKAATLENCHFIGIEQNAEYAAIAEARIAHAGGPLFS